MSHKAIGNKSFSKKIFFAGIMSVLNLEDSAQVIMLLHQAKRIP